jgi:Holliday junction DNA helicase RuvA subunit
MIAYIRGILAEKEPTRAVVEAGGVGYELFIPLSTYDRLPRQGEEAKLLAAHVVRDDAEALFGFATAEEREMFTMLVSVSGVGPKIALSMLSGTSLGDLAQAIAGGDVKRISSIKGVGRKTAGKICVELKDKVSQLVLVFPALCIPDNWRERYPRLQDIQDVTELWGVKMGRRFFEEIHDMRPLDLIGQYRGPVLIVQGDADRVVSMDDSRRAQQLYRPGTLLHVIPGAGHGFKPHEFQEEMEQLQQFLKRP